MEHVLRGLQWKNCVCFLDDIIVFGRSVDELLDNLGLVFERLQEANLKLKPSKCKMFCEQVQFLGHVVSGSGIACDPGKVSAVANWPQPRNVSEVRSFLGTAGYYRKFVKGFAAVASPLTALTEKGRKFVWSEECEKAFDTLKLQLTTAPILAYPSPDPDDKYILDTDASDTGIGAVLSQVQNGAERVIAYGSQVLSAPQRAYCTTYRELLAVVEFVLHFKHYLLGLPFTIRTDHGSLRWLHKFKDVEGMVGRWISKLAPYNYDITHRRGILHGNADGLSRQIYNSKPRRRCARPECSHCSAHQVSPLLKRPDGSVVVREIEGNLFDCPDNQNLVHCVAEDFHMGKGIAVESKKRFGEVDELVSQGIRTGGLAVLQSTGRYINYLVSKSASHLKLTMSSYY